MSQLGRYYDWLGRFQRLAGYVSRSGDATLTVHRRLRSDPPGIPEHDVVHERLLAALGGVHVPHVIDAGCGLGGTTFWLMRRLGGRYDGLTLSASQRERAERASRRLGVSGSCRFHLRSFDDDLSPVAPEGADLVIAIESLAHSPDPARTIANLARVLRPGGRLAVVDDVPADALPDDDPDFLGFRQGWHAPRIARRESIVRAFEAAGLDLERDQDLTPLVVLRDRARLERRVGVNEGFRRLLRSTPLATLVDSLHGGLMLERLYGRGLMEYRLLVGTRRAPPQQ